MADDDRPASHAIVSGEASLPDEHTARVRAAAEKSKPQPTQHKVHDGPGPSPPQRSSTEMAEASKKARRRERDNKAERRAMQMVVGLFVGLGAIGFFAVGYLVDDPPPPAPPPPVKVDPNAPPPPAKRLPGTQVSAFAEGSDIPALRSLKSEGLTIAAEGLPEVLADAEDGSLANLAALETCRYAYGVWEFSPNKRFRFITTCEALEGQIFVGAYEVSGANIRMSPLQSVEGQLISEFAVEKPSMMRTKVVTANGHTLEVNQRVTIMRAGMEGEAFHDTYAPKNTIAIPGQRKGGDAPAPTKGPLLDLLKGDE